MKRTVVAFLSLALSLTIQTNLQASPDSPGKLPVELPSEGGVKPSTPVKEKEPDKQSTSPNPVEPVQKKIPTDKTGVKDKGSTKEKTVTAVLEVTDQQLQENKVVVSKVIMSKPGWLVIHGDVSGHPGPILGKVSLKVGEFADVAVALIVPPKNEKLWAMLHIDEGKRGLYDFGIDGPLVQDGSIVMMPFSTK
jgi:hypothetical protein